VQKRVLREAFGSTGAAQIKKLGAKAGLRPLIIRRAREDRSRAAGLRTVLVGHAGAAGGWLERLEVSDLRELRNLDLDALALGRAGHGSAVDGPVLLVCTHGSRDVCCAVYGRPVAASLAAAHPGLAWEVSHVGGHRFAGNLVVAPYGLYYGRLDPATALRVAGEAVAGRIDTGWLRGRSLWEPAGQWAEVELRRQTGAMGLADVAVEEVESTGDHRWTVTLAGPGGSRWECHVTADKGTAATSICSGVSTTRSFATRSLEQS
jgi:hypothetical protein